MKEHERTIVYFTDNKSCRAYPEQKSKRTQEHGPVPDDGMGKCNLLEV